MDPISLPSGSIEWLRRLAHAHEHSEGGWLEEESLPPSAALLAVGVVQRDGGAYRLTDIGWWMVQRVPGI